MTGCTSTVATNRRMPSVPTEATARSRLSTGRVCTRYRALFAMRSRLAASTGSCATIRAIRVPDASGSLTSRISCGSRPGRRGV